EGGPASPPNPGRRGGPAPPGALRAGPPEIEAPGGRGVGIRPRTAADAADQRIVARPAGKQVVAGGAVDPVVVCEPAQHVVAAAAIEVILPRRAGQAVVIVATGEQRSDR